MVKPKVSSGYLTPQAKKHKPASTKKTTTSQDAEMNGGIDEEVFQALMNDPEKKQAILQLLLDNKEAIEDYRKKEQAAKVASPTNKVKRSEKHLESPSALLRKRLEKMHGTPCSCAPSISTSASESRCSSPNCLSPESLNKVLRGVVAFLDIKNRQGEDKSAGAKSVLISLGAKIRDTFTSDVTHVVFKDGSLSTYEKAKLRNIHLVSILWVDFCRKTRWKQSERLYPALRSAYDDESMICSQMEKDYEAIIRDEYKKSMTQGTPLPSTRALIDRRRTLMTPFGGSFISTSDSQNTEDIEVAAINGFNMSQNLVATESLVMNDPENFTQPIRTPSLRVLTSIENTDMELTSIPETQSIVTPQIHMELTDVCAKRKTHRRRTICNSLMSSDNSTLSGLAKENSFGPKEGPDLRGVEEQSFIIGKNSVKVRSLNGDVEKTASAISVLKISSDDRFSLRLTEDSDKRKRMSQLFSDKGFALRLSSEKQASMSALQLSSDKQSISASGLCRPGKKSSDTDSVSSNDSEVLITTKNVTKNDCVSQMEQPGKKSVGRARRKTLGPEHVRRDICLDSPGRQKGNSDESSGNVQTLNKTKSKFGKRKLYCPGDQILLTELDDEVERQQRREELQNRKRKSSDEIVLPLGDLMKKLPAVSTSSESEVPLITPPKRTRKKTQKKQPEINESFDSSMDAQNELLEEVLRRKKEEETSKKSPGASSRKTKPNVLEPRTPSTRRSMRIIKTPAVDVQETRKVAPRNRRSTLDYMSKSEIASHMKKAYKKGEKVGMSTIVCTKCHKADVQLFGQIVKKLGKFTVEDEVTDKTTHLIAGESKRTVNMLRGLVRGCWILKYEWLLRSLEEGKWLPEEDFEVTDFSPAVQKCRLERQAFGSRYKMDVFESCPPIYVALNATPRCSDLRELITTCKGKIVRLTKLAQIVVGQYCEGAVCVNESWVLDSITFYRTMPFKDKYLIKG